MPYEASLTDEERKSAKKLGAFWDGVATGASLGGSVLGHPVIGTMAKEAASAIARGQHKIADTGTVRKSTLEEQKRIDEFYDAHPSHW